VQLGVLDSQRLAQEFARLSPEFRGLLLSVDKRLKQLNERAVECRSGKVENLSLAENKKPVLAQGATEENLYIIREGSASIVRHEEYGRISLAQLYKGDYFGNISFLELGHEPESASVMAAKEFKVRKVDLERLREEYNQLSTTFKNFVDNVATCVAVSTQVVCNYHKRYGKGQ